MSSNDKMEVMKRKINLYSYENLEEFIKRTETQLMSNTLNEESTKTYNDLLIYAKEKFEKVREQKAKSLFEELDEDINDILKKDEELLTYDQLKKQFETNHFKIMAPLGYFVNKHTNADDLDDKASLLSRKEIMDMYENLYCCCKEIKKGGTYEMKTIKFIDKWLKDKTIKTYRTIMFNPRNKTPDDVFNLFDGFRAEKMKSNKTIEDLLTKSKMMKHIKEIICDNKEDIFNYLMFWLSRLVKNPTDLTAVCIVLKSEEGTGKDLFWDYIGKNILGSKYYINTKQEHLTGNFNSLIDKKILAVIAEANGEIRGREQMVENLKTLISDTTPKIEKKKKDPIPMIGCCNIGASSNRDKSFNVDAGSRRFQFIEVSNKYSQKNLLLNPELKPEATTYFNELVKEMKSGVYDKPFYDYLTSLNSCGYAFDKNLISNDSLEECKLLSSSPVIQFLINKLENNRLKPEYNSTELYAKYNQYIQDNNIQYKITGTKFGLELKKVQGIIKNKFGKVSYSIDIQKVKNYFMKLRLYRQPETDFIDDESSNETDDE